MDKISSLARKMESSDDSQCLRAVHELGKSGDARAVGVLMEAMKHQSMGMKINIIEALGNTKNEKPIQLLSDVLEKENQQLRARAATALGKIGSTRTVPVLLDSLEDSIKEVREKSANALKKVIRKNPDHDWNRIVPDLAAKLDDDWRVSSAIGDCIREIGMPAVPILLEKLKNNGSSMKWMVLWSIIRIAEENKDADFDHVLPEVSKTLEAHCAEIRSISAQILGEIGDASAVPSLLFALKDNDLRVKRDIRNALRSILKRQHSEDNLESFEKQLRMCEEKLESHDGFIETRIEITKLMNLMPKTGKSIVLEGSIKKPRKRKQMKRNGQIRTTG